MFLMKKNELKNIIKEEIIKLLDEHRYQYTATPLNTKTGTDINLGINPLTVDNGNRTPNDVLGQPSTFDRNGASFTTDNNIVLSDNKFTIYKIKNFGTDKITASIDLFGRGANGEKNFRKEIDIMNGAATRNNRNLIYRTITSDAFQRRSKSSGKMSNTFWEFSFDNGNTWYIMKPNGTQTMQASKLIRKQ
jgi:hypothetical protein